MKRLRSSDDLDSFAEKAGSKEWGRREEESGSSRSLLHRSSYHKSESGRKLASSFTRHDRIEDDGDSLRPIKKRSDYDVDGYDRKKSYDRYRDGSGERGILSSSPRSGYGADRFHRSESFSGIKRDFPKGFRSERDRSRREGSVSSWRSFGGGKDSDEGIRSSGESVKINCLDTDDGGKVKYPQGLKDAKSPPWSKDSGSEQSKSMEVKKNDKSPVESDGNSSEMEEGELEPEGPDPLSLPATEPTAEKQASCDAHQQKLVSNHTLEHNHQVERVNSSSEEHVELNKMPAQNKQVEGSLSKDHHGMLKDVHELVDSQTVKQVVSGVCHGDFEAKASIEGAKDEECCGENIILEEVVESSAAKQQNVIKEQRGEKHADVQAGRDKNNMWKLNDRLLEANVDSSPAFSDAMVETTDSFKDKGKTLASASNFNFSAIEQVKITNRSNGPDSCSDSYNERLSTRGLDLFTSDPIKKSEKDIPLRMNDKSKDDKLALDLSLSLPNVLLPIGHPYSDQPPGSPSHARSAQSFHSSFRTTSEGYTASMSFSGSQQFTHNPSCSLAHDSLDNEQSVKSRPLFQGVDWQALASEDRKSNEVPIVQSMFQNANGLHQQLQASQGHSNGQPVTNQGIFSQGSLRTAGQERQLSFSKQFPGVQPQKLKNARSPTQSVGSYETGSGYSKDKKRGTREMDGVSLGRISYSDGRGQLWSVGSDFVESIISMVCSDPLSVVCQRFNEMSGQQLLIIKDSACDIIMNPGKQLQRRTFQRELVSRSDITIETLMQSHRTQLEILVAMKTNLHEFLRLNIEISSTDLAEIFLNLRCRNLTCRSLLPVDECDCNICSKKGGFCSACMCLVCSKFDMASNTCSWVGCDVCLHWCHTDCGLRESHIRTGCSASGADGATEMQFHCVACDHPSEMFGFVKEVFQNCAKDWTAETLSRELEYVRRIFSGSEDLRGKRLHGIAVQLLSDLENNVDLHQIQRYLLRFFSDPDDFFKHSSALTVSRRELPLKDAEKNDAAIIGSSRDAEWKRSMCLDKPLQSDKAVVLYGDGIKDTGGKLDAQTSNPRDHAFDELESIVRIKHAEAQMFQTRADDARREAEALKRITVTKNEKVEEEYTSRLSKLKLSDTEETRKQKLEELRAVERDYQDYFHMKMRMESEIKDMLLKMEATRRNLIS